MLNANPPMAAARRPETYCGRAAAGLGWLLSMTCGSVKAAVMGETEEGREPANTGEITASSRRLEFALKTSVGGRRRACRRTHQHIHYTRRHPERTTVEQRTHSPAQNRMLSGQRLQPDLPRRTAGSGQHSLGWLLSMTCQELQHLARRRTRARCSLRPRENSLCVFAPATMRTKCSRAVLRRRSLGRLHHSEGKMGSKRGPGDGWRAGCMRLRRAEIVSS